MKILSSSACTLYRSFLVGFAVFFSISLCASAEDLDSVELAPIDFDTNTSLAITNLARSIVGVNASQATVDDTAASIYTLLQAWSLTASSGQMVKTMPYSTQGGIPIGTELGRALFSTWNANQSPSVTQSFLYQIQRILFGQSGSVSGDLAIQPTLLRIEDLLENPSWTSNDVQTVLLSLESIIDRSGNSAWTTNDVDLVTRILAGCDWENTINPWMAEMASYSHALAISMGYNTYDNVSAQWVHEVNSDTVVSSLEDIAANVSGDHDYMSEIVSLLHDMYDLQTSQVELSETASNVVIDATAKAEQEGQEAEDEVEKSFDDVETEYPEYMMPDERGLSYPSDQSGLTGVSYNLNHGTTIKLLEATPAYSLPRMEVELFANGGQATAIHNITSAVRLGWTALFSLLTFFLYLETYRRARAMLLHTQSAGKAGANLTLGFQSDHGVVS